MADLTREQESRARLVIGEQGIINNGLRSKRYAHENPRSTCIFNGKSADAGSIAAAKREGFEGNGRESERRGHGGAQDKKGRVVVVVVKETAHVMWLGNLYL